MGAWTQNKDKKKQKQKKNTKRENKTKNEGYSQVGVDGGSGGLDGPLARWWPLVEVVCATDDDDTADIRQHARAGLLPHYPGKMVPTAAFDGGDGAVQVGHGLGQHGRAWKGGWGGWFCSVLS